MLLSGSRIERGSRIHGVSILVLVDVAQWPTATGRVGAGSRFQSLFSWMLLSGPRQWRTLARPRGFNPCSRGCCSVARGSRRFVVWSFNPCSRGCCSVASTAFRIGTGSARFQSLFSWMLLSGTAGHAGGMRSGRGFNPCSRGCCSVARRRRGRDGAEVSILVLVDVAQWLGPALDQSDAWVSILVLVDVAQWQLAEAVTDQPLASVSILVLVDVAQWLDLALTASAGRWVSILVLVDVAQWPRPAAICVRDSRFQSLFSWMLLSGTAAAAERRSGRLMFQSLFSWMLLSGPHAREARAQTGDLVSILVLVDVAQWPATRSGTRHDRRCFNPCSRGCCSVAIGTCRSCADLEVSILVLVDVAQWPLRCCSRGSADHDGFQSLFSWMLLSGSRLSYARHQRSASFNPCSRGCCSVAGRSGPYRPADRGFNPCSRGCCSVAQSRRPGRPIRSKFQSLFSWMLLSGIARCRALRCTVGVSILVLVDVAQWHVTVREHCPDRLEFQSLFSWMLLSGRRLRQCADVRLRSFNPCSRGCCSVALVLAAGDRRHREVSILVLVDVAQWRRSGRIVRPGHAEVSILVLVDVAQWPRHGRATQAVEGFNPCSRGCCSVATTRACAGVVGRVSILVLVDVAQWPMSSARHYAEREFQSLFSWMLLSGPS